MNTTAPGARTGRFPSLLLAVATLTAVASAQVQLEPRWSKQIEALDAGIPLETDDIAVGDVDGDGDLDMVLALDTFTAVLMRNDGDGRFERSWLPASFGRRSVAALFDADGDGDLDLLLASGVTGYGTSGPSALLTNDGSGSFTEVTAVPATVLDTVGVQVGDLDGDGDLDLVLSDSNLMVRIWRNNGAATFTDVTATAFVAGFGAGLDCRLGDVDGDGDLDLVTRTLAYGNDGSGHFAPLAGWPGWPNMILALADLDSDGDLDLVTQNQVLRNDGGLVFTAQGVLPTGSGPGGSPDLFRNERRFVVDVDGDGLLDLLGVDSVVRPVFLRNVGDFVFQDASSSWFEPHALADLSQGDPNQGLARGTCAVLDADGDGDLDLVTGGNEGRMGSSTTVGIPPRVFLSVQGTGFVEASRGSFPWFQDTSAAIAAGDVDGDGDVDLLFSYLGYVQSSLRTAIWRQDGLGRFAEDPIAPTTRQLSAALLADVDGDGDLDLFGAAGVGPELLSAPVPHVLARNAGDGTFTDVSATNLPATAVSVGASCAAGDIDGDGDVDLVVGSYDPNFGPGVPLQLLQNDGLGSFTDASAQLPATLCNARWLALRDLDGDGDLDLLVADGRNPFASATPTLCFANDGTGTFTDVTAARIPAGAGFGLDVQDLDSDGDLDVAQSNATLWNDGSGTFTVTPSATGRLLVADFDRDGILDDVRSQNGNSLLVGGQTIPFGNQVQQHVALAVDLDGDADLDLVVACLLGMGNPNTSRVNLGVLINRYRDLEEVSMARLGQPCRLRLRGRTPPTGLLAALVTSPGTLPQPTAVPGFEGLLVLDPSFLIAWGFSTVPDSTTAVEAVLAVPADPWLQGLVVTTQALFSTGVGVSPISLSNPLQHTLGW